VLGGQTLKEVKPSGQSALVIGNESKGIRPELMNVLTQHITIPRLGHAESLNAGVAAGIILSHLVL
jgi:TrmH family RNA methyltransferase